MLRTTFAILIAMTLLFGPGALGVRSAKAAQCSPEQGQLLIYAGRYKDAIKEFTCMIKANPTGVEGYRGRIEAQLLLGLYSDAFRDYTHVTAWVLPVQPNAASVIYAGYASRLSANPQDIPALTGASFARWYFFDYAHALQLLNQLLSVQPDNLYGNLFRGSTRLLLGPNPNQGLADLEYAITLAPQSPDVHYIAADAFLYGQSDYTRAFQEATIALNGGLDTPRVHAILASAQLSFGDHPAAAGHFKRHIDLVTTELVPASPLSAGTTLSVGLVPGRTYEIPIPAVAGQVLWVTTNSQDFTDTIMVLLAPNGTPVTGNDDYRRYFAGIQWPAAETGIYRLQVTSFESTSIGILTVAHK